MTDLLCLAVTKTALKELLPADELRQKLGARWPDLMAGGCLNLEILWSLYAGHADFNPQLAQHPMCWLKTLEGRLGLPVDLPGALATLKSNEIATHAAKVFIKREDLEGLLGPAPASRGRATTPAPGGRSITPLPPGRAMATPVSGVAEPGAPPAAPEPGAPPEDPATARRDSGPSAWKPAARTAASPTQAKKIAGIVAGFVALGSIVALAGSLRAGCRKPPTPMSTSAMGAIPVKSGHRLGRDATFVLADAGWLALPLDKRTADLGEALEGLSSSGVEVLIIVDDKRNPVASAQKVGGKLQVRFH